MRIVIKYRAAVRDVIWASHGRIVAVLYRGEGAV